MLRCEMGDLTKKHAPFKVNGGRQFYHDVNLPLFGKNSGNVEMSNTLFNGPYRIFAQTPVREFSGLQSFKMRLSGSVGKIAQVFLLARFCVDKFLFVASLNRIRHSSQHFFE